MDLANTTASFTASVVPEGLAMHYSPLTMAQMRKNGVLDYLSKTCLEKGLYYFARTTSPQHGAKLREMMAPK